MVMSASQAAAKYASRAKLAGADYVAGFVGTNKDIVGRAIERSGVWHEAVSSQRALDKYVAGLKNTSTAEVKEIVRKLGSQRYTQGIEKGKAKYEKNIAPVLAHIAADSENIRDRPVITPEDGAQKSYDWILYMAKFSKAA